MKNIKLLVLMLFSFSSLAAVIDITADYKPESYEASGGRFINTTPCEVGQPVSYCDPQKPIESSVIIKLPVSIAKTINSTKGKQGYLSYYRLSGPKNVMLTNSSNGERHELTFIPTNIGAKVIKMRYPLVNDNKWPMHPIGGDCYTDFIGWGWWVGSIVTDQLFLHLIKHAAQNGPSECYYNSQLGDGTSYTVDWLNYGFRIKSPNPLTMSNGKYTGSVKIMVGRNQDIDLGDAIYSGGTEHELKFTLTVRHQLKVDFPKGDSDGHSQVTLLPPGGWINWMHNGKREPSLLQQDLPFRIWFSAPFTVALRCQHQWGTECGLKDGKGRTVPLKTYYVNSTNEMTLLTTNKHSFVLPVQGKPVINAARAIRFQVVGGTVAEMMKYPGSSFKGDVTLIFDAAID
ncbi:hypothetical protein [Aeromonas veronii]|uniref:hypothetical protein n=1 Tax=Aeromonas veronii TaxID=654 RepID=UPI0029D6E60F|nr:hypothetical protein [Aeromonas veronii]MDX7874652.1 hypothetical protein [Aeromonas veronii]